MRMRLHTNLKHYINQSYHTELKKAPAANEIQMNFNQTANATMEQNLMKKEKKERWW